MNASFWDSNLFQTLVLIVTIGAMFGVALWQFYAHKRKELRNAVSILMLQINDIEQNVEYIIIRGTYKWYYSRGSSALFYHNF